MMDDQEETSTLLEDVRLEYPDAVRLALVISLAVRVEPELLRSTRLALLPGIDAGAEADLWFSPLVQGDNPLAFVLLPEVKALLQQELAGDQELLDRAWHVLKEVHRDAPPVIHLEEEITWLALSSRPDALQRIEILLQSAVVAMVNENRLGLAHWALRAIPRLPGAARQTDPVRMLAVGARARVGEPQRGTEDLQIGAEQGWLRYVLPDNLPRVPLGVRLLDQAVEFGDPLMTGAHLLELPETNPLLLEVSWHEGGTPRDEWVSLKPGEARIVDAISSEIKLRTALGEIYILRQRPTSNDYSSLTQEGFINVPDWFSFENQGTGITITNLGNNGQQDMIVLMVDHTPGQNRGLYKVGKNLDPGGKVTGGWGNWIAIPDWFPRENQGAGIAVTELDGDNRPELVVFMIDNPPGQNVGYYRVGKSLDADGNVTGGWGPWIAIPNWFPWENQGAGIAIVDLDNSGLLDVIVFMIDNPLGQNQAFYKIGKNIHADGAVIGGWGSWLGVPGWFSWENQGSGIALRNVDGKHELFVLMVDHPVGQNAGKYCAVELEDDPKMRGTWELLPYYSEVVAVHAAVLSTGKVLFCAGAGSSQTRFRSHDFGNMAKGIWTSVIWDPMKPPLPNTDSNFFHPNTMQDEHGITYDFFCGGESFLPDGRLLQGGGSLDYPRDGHGFLGLKNAFLLDPQTEQWTQVEAMAHGRWYPTLIMLADGRILAASGLDENGNLNTTLEMYSPDNNTWQELPVPPIQKFLGLPLYAHLFVMQDGQILFTGGRMDDASPLGPCLLDLAQHPVHVTPLPGLNNPASRNQSASVLLPPAQGQKVMIIGGGPMEMADATDSVDVIDLKAANPTFQAVMPMNLPRMHLNAVLLPDHTVFVSGGALKREFGMAARLQSELYDPATDSWRIGATATVARMYHSIALLLPDGRVIAAGSNPQGGHQVQWVPTDPNEELRMEVYSPPYLFKGPRPVIDATPTDWNYGNTVTIQSQQAETIRWVSIIKPGVTTHSFNNGQRLVDLDILSQGVGVIKATVTNKPTIAPPGWYMLFITDTTGVPSVAKWVHLAHA